jgi:uncharacterized protein
MRLVLDNDPQILSVRSYAPGLIDVAGQAIRAPCILSPGQLITDWPVRAAAELDETALAPILALRPALVLIGAGASTDATAVAAAANLRRSLQARGVALEIMDLGAACRTYNVLAQERREVVAGLFP